VLIAVYHPIALTFFQGTIVKEKVSVKILPNCYSREGGNSVKQEHRI